MFRAFPEKPYRQRAKIETIFSVVKRKRSSRAPGRSLPIQIRQALEASRPQVGSQQSHQPYKKLPLTTFRINRLDKPCATAKQAVLKPKELT
jgi:hypothetical protein